ncbi:aspartate aminotransferase family protein [Labrys wisconsinensis]|uniref:Adenosylmethionine-8-amino-7-oxononanoate aminotransferase n=1 Tax=Labrys wisconsinensis TaxID=425677 RepID=A0ABU0J419_9HYPH|nr:aspartate aminotransferase family protein [Labrys wisconsinensis]MDQ0468360.1 adenosylmethionine-8-amino-7-oxononanoate aminotransferase [Labrys wisconsinensis]
MSHVFHRMPRQAYPVAVGGEGAYVLDADGKRYLDASGGAAVSCLGHSHAGVIAAIKAQLDALPFAHTSFFTTPAAEALADLLAESAPPGLDHVYFVSGGSEAIEAALKLARQYFVERGEPQRRRFIARRQSYHGNTLGALAVGGNLGRRTLFEPLLIDVEHVSPCYAYRDQQAGETAQAYGERLARELDATIERLGAETVIGFVAETVSGATLGAVPAVPGYFQRLREVCDRHGILLILDEVMCGMGRTGTLFACEQEGMVPDIVTVAKGLGAGYQPIGAMIASSKVYEAILAGSGFFHHGHTYVGHAAACAGALAVQRAIAEENLLARVRELGAGLASRLRQVFQHHEHVGDIRGRGLFWGLEFVADKAAKLPFDPALRLHARIKANAMHEGLMCYPSGGTLDGRAGDHVLLAPPYILEEPQLDEIVEKLGRAVDRSIAEIRGAAAAS